MWKLINLGEKAKAEPERGKEGTPDSIGSLGLDSLPFIVKYYGLW